MSVTPNPPEQAEAAAQPAGELHPGTLQAMFELVRESPRRQQAVQEALDDKTLRLLVAGAVILGLAGITVGGRPAGPSLVFAIAAVTAFALVAASAAWQLWPRIIRDRRRCGHRVERALGSGSE